MAKEVRVTNKNPFIPMMVGLFFTSISLLIFQVFLTRLFSPMFQYHYVFLLTSMAIFGLGLGGLISYRLGTKLSLEAMRNLLPLYLLLLAVSFIVVFLIIFKMSYMSLIILYSGFAVIPYIIGGIYIASVFRILPSACYRLYFADLLGSAMGSIAVVYLISNIGMANVILVISGLMALNSVILSFFFRRNIRFPLVLLIIIIISAGFQNQVRQFEWGFTGYLTSPSTSLARMRAANVEHSLVDWVWDAFSRADLIDDTDDGNKKVISIDGGANSLMLRFDGDLDNYQSLKYDLNYLPFALGNQDRVLLIGPGGGKDVVFALLGKSGEIDAVEISGSSVELVRRYGAFNGYIYDREDVNVYIQDGRNFVKQTNNKYDTIYLAQVMAGAAETVGFSLAENFIYTKEAIQDYWNALKDNGTMSFVMHGQQDFNRIVFTILEALEDIGVPREQLINHIVAVNRSTPGHEGANIIHMPLVMVQKSPYTHEQIDMIMAKIAGYSHTPILIPYELDGGLLTAYSAGNVNLTDIYKQLPANLTPTTDNRPFFFDYYHGVDSTLLVLLGGVAIISLLFVKPLVGNKKLRKPSLYFMGLGIGYMMIEIPLIQKYSLLLGHPTRSFIVILTALLIGSGIGSLFGGWSKLQIRNKYIPLLMVAALAIVVNVISGLLVDRWFSSSLNMRVIATFISLLPLGFFMGMPFPRGIKMLRDSGIQEIIPLIWGFNGIISVGGAVLAVIFSMKAGFSFTIWTGAAIYAILFFLIPLVDNGSGNRGVV